MRSLPVIRQQDLRLRLLPGLGGLNDISIMHIDVPRGSRFPAVLHKKTDELVYIVSGKGFGVVGNEKMKLKAGDFIHIPARRWHQFTTTDSRMKVLALFSPKMNMQKPDACLKKGDNQ